MAWAGDITNLNGKGRRTSSGLSDYEALTWMLSQPGAKSFRSGEFSSYCMASSCVDSMLGRVFDIMDCVKLRDSSGFDVRPIDLLFATHAQLGPIYLAPLQGNYTVQEKYKLICGKLPLGTPENWGALGVQVALYGPKVESVPGVVRKDPVNLSDQIQLSTWRFLELSGDIFALFQHPTGPIPANYALLERDLNGTTDLSKRKASAPIPADFLSFIFGRLDWSTLSAKKQTNLFGLLKNWTSTALRLNCQSLTDEILAGVCKHSAAVQHVRTIDLSGCIALTSETVQLLESYCPSLTALAMNGCVGLSTFAAKWKRLEVLELRDCAKLVSVSGDYPRLEVILLERSSQLGEVSIHAPRLVSINAKGTKDAVCRDIYTTILEAPSINSVVFPVGIFIDPQQIERSVSNIGDMKKCADTVRDVLKALLSVKRRPQWEAVGAPSADRLIFRNSPKSTGFNKALSQIAFQLAEYLKVLDVSGCEDVDGDGLESVLLTAKHLQDLRASSLVSLKALVLKGPEDAANPNRSSLALRSLQVVNCPSFETICISSYVPNLTEMDLSENPKLHLGSLLDDSQALVRVPNIQKIRFGSSSDSAIVCADLATQNKSIVQAVALSSEANQTVVLVGYSEGSIECRMFTQELNSRAVWTPRAHSAPITALISLTPSESHSISAVSASSDGSLCFWESLGAMVLRAEHVHTGAVSSLIELSPGQLISAGWDQVVVLSVLQSDHILRQVKSPAVHKGMISAIAKLSDSSFATACHDGFLRLWSAHGGEIVLVSSIADFHGATVGTTGLWASSGGETLIACGWGNFINVYHVGPEGLKLSRRLDKNNVQIRDVVTLGKFVIAAGSESSLLVWKATADSAESNAVAPEKVALDVSHFLCERLHLLAAEDIILVHCSDSVVRAVDFHKRAVIRSIALDCRASASCEAASGQVILTGNSVFLLPRPILQLTPTNEN